MLVKGLGFISWVYPFLVYTAAKNYQDPLVTYASAMAIYIGLKKSATKQYTSDSRRVSAFRV